MAVKILLRRDITTNWETVNPILSMGELGVEITATNERKIKLGDGLTSWTSLDYLIDDTNISTDLLNHINDTDVHGATDTPTADKIVKYNADLGLKSDKAPIDDNDVVRKLELDNVNVDLTDYYNKNEVDELVEDINLTDYYNKEEVNEKLDDYNISVNGLLTMGPPDYLNSQGPNVLSPGDTWTAPNNGYVRIVIRTNTPQRVYATIAGSNVWSFVTVAHQAYYDMWPVTKGNIVSIGAPDSNLLETWFIPPVINPPVKLEAQPLLDYSTEEQDTGRKWIDGKTIYQKTILFNPNKNIGSGSNVLVGTIANLFTGATEIINHITQYYDTLSNNGIFSSVMLRFNSGDVHLFNYSVATLSVPQLRITVWYTK